MAVGRIYIDGEIIPDEWSWLSYEDWGYTSLRIVREQIDAIADLTELEVYIFSNGGFCSEGWAIHDFLLTLGIPVTTICYGQCASIATVIYMAGNVRKITPSTDFMIHLPWGDQYGANEHAALTFYNELVVEGAKIVNRYVARTGGLFDTIKESMREDNHMTAEQTVTLKYSTEVLGDSTTENRLKNLVKNATPARNRKPVLYLREPAKKEKAKRPETEPVTPPVVANTFVSESTKFLKKVHEMASKKAMGPIAVVSAGLLNLAGGKPYYAQDINIDGGKVLVIDVQGDQPAAGDPCTIDNAPAPAGDYTATADKTKYTVGEDGKLTAVTAADAPADQNNPAPAPAPAPTDIAVRLAKLEAQAAEKDKAIAHMASLLKNVQSPDPVVAAPPTVVPSPTDGVKSADEIAKAKDDALEPKDWSKGSTAIVRARLKAQYEKDQAKAKA